MKEEKKKLHLHRASSLESAFDFSSPRVSERFLGFFSVRLNWISARRERKRLGFFNIVIFLLVVTAMGHCIGFWIKFHFVNPNLSSFNVMTPDADGEWLGFVSGASNSSLSSSSSRVANRSRSANSRWLIWIGTSSIRTTRRLRHRIRRRCHAWTISAESGLWTRRARSWTTWALLGTCT